MQLHTLSRKIKNKKEKRVGRGGKRGTYSGKGLKGQKARAGHKMRPELRDIIKRLPKMRGRGKNSLLTIGPKPAAVNLDVLEASFVDGAIVNPVELVNRKLVRPVSGRPPAVKILARGNLSKKLSIVSCLVSAEAMKKIKAAGGTVGSTKES